MHSIRPHKHHFPTIHPEAWVDSSAVVIGEVKLGRKVSVWPTCVLRGDQGLIFIDDESNIQDGTIIHSTGGLSTTHVGKRCTIGHRVLLHGCTIEDDCLIGMGAIVLDNSIVGSGSIVGAGALVTANTVIPPNSLVLGMPAKVVKTLSKVDQTKWIAHGHEEYIKLLEEVLETESQE
jgi:carbonic anhydrase/acetyltransferase-like protein (isoleucine patch superfamily)